MSDQQELFARISDLRREYTLGRLRHKDLPDCPSVLFDHWLRQACDAKLPDPTAMCVATVDDRGQPFQRIMLLKQVNHESMTFYTNLGSRKAQHIQQNAKVSLHFPWYFLERQVMVQGVAEKLSSAEVAGYFHSRPRDSQIGAWVSPQSRPVSGRAVLEEKFLEMTQKFIHGDVPLPDFWGGYRVRFHTMEFWQGGCHRLHDRFLYEKQDQHWKIQRLAP